jgi:hypothetical protein
MFLPLHPLKGSEKTLVALAEFDYLTASQLTRLLYAPSSHAHVRKQLNALVAAGFVIPLVGRFVTMPRLYTLTGTGYSYAAALSVTQEHRVRPAEEQEKAHNLYFIQHTIAVTDVLIAARLLSRTVPAIRLTRLITERELKRTTYVEVPERRCLEPDASVQFTVAETWEHFFTSKSTVRISRNAGSSTKSAATLPMSPAQPMKRSFTPLSLPLPSLPHLPSSQTPYNPGLSRYCTHSSRKHSASSSSLAALIRQQQVPLISFFPRSGGRHSALSPHRCLSLRRRTSTQYPFRNRHECLQ